MPGPSVDRLLCYHIPAKILSSHFVDDSQTGNADCRVSVQFCHIGRQMMVLVFLSAMMELTLIRVVRAQVDAWNRLVAHS